MADMKMCNATWATAYTLFQIIQGLLVHPYQTTRQLVRERVFVWVVGLPVGLWVTSVVVWKVLELMLFRLLPLPGLWLFLALWFTTGIIMYQILLLYLCVRFTYASQRRA